MITLLEQELENIKHKIFDMTDAVIESIAKATDSLKNGDIPLAEEVIKNDSLIDRLEKEIDDDCIRAMVTKQPAAIDMRLALSFLKINTDLERIGDLASNIAKETIKLKECHPVNMLVDLPGMASISISMIKRAFEAMIARDVTKAAEVIKMDKQIDEMNLQIFRKLFAYMSENPQDMTRSLGLIMSAKGLERIGDHVKNIAERIIYYIEGIDIRHMKS